MTDVEDRAAIIDLITTYARAVDTKDWDLYETLFTSDAVIDYTSSGGIRADPGEMRKWVSRALEPFTMTQHLVTNHDIVVNGDAATCHSDFYNPMGSPDPGGGLRLFYVGGAYRDKLRRTPDGWRFSERVEEMRWFDGNTPKNLGTSS